MTRLTRSEGFASSGAGADFSFASSDFKTLGAFFCNFPGLDWRRLQSRRRLGQRERRADAGEAARLDRRSVRRAGEASEILVRFRAISMLCEAENFPSASPRVEFDNVLAAPRRSARSAARPVPDVVASRLPSYYNFRARIQSFQAVAAPFPGKAVLPLGKRFVERLGTDLEARKKAKAPQPLIRRLAAQRDASRGFDGGRRRFWMAGLL
jgi:hypothetical protein